MKRRSSLWHVLLALALLITQQGAALHALTHVSASSVGQFVPDKQSPHGDHACELCIAYCGVGAGISASPLALPTIDADVRILDLEVAAGSDLEGPPFLSRAPPARFALI